eukprot:scaffold77439_cov57-Phaeocystis_antarctica.AAC.1
MRMNLKKAGTANGFSSRKACNWSGVFLCGSTMRRSSRRRSVRSSSCPISSGNSFSGQPSRSRSVRRQLLQRAELEDELDEGPQLPDFRRQLLQRAAVEAERGEGPQLPDLGRQLHQLAAAEAELSEGLQLTDLRRQHLQRALGEVEPGEGLQLPDLGRQHLQLAALEVEPLDAVIAPFDAYPRAWMLAIGPPLLRVYFLVLQRRAHRPHRPQRILVWLCGGTRQSCFLRDIDGAAAVGVGQVGELRSSLGCLAEPIGEEDVAGEVADNIFEEGGHPQ